jgi:hypothetical protein
MSAYTSFVAVDTSERAEGADGTTVHQAVPVPDGAGMPALPDGLVLLH